MNSCEVPGAVRCGMSGLIETELITFLKNPPFQIMFEENVIEPK